MQKIISWLNSHPETKSILITFVAVFITTIVTLIKATNEEWTTLLESGTIWGILIAAGRTALKLAVEKALLLLSTKAE